MAVQDSQQDLQQKSGTSAAAPARNAVSRPSASAGLSPAQLAAAMAVVRHHADRMAQRQSGRSETRGEPRERR